MGFSLDDINPLNLLKTEYDTQQQVPLETPEQRAARKKLMDYANTGQFGKFVAGEEIPVNYGDYDVTGIENQGLSSLQKLLQSGIPQQYSMGDAAMRDLMDTSEAGIEKQFSPFRAIAEREIKNQNNSVKRNAAFGGNLFSTGTYRALNDVGARGNETMTAKLAELTNNALNRKASMIPLAFQSGREQEGLAMDRISASQTYGGLPRILNNAKMQERNDELLRRRQELQLPINAAQTVASQNAQFGVPEVKVAKPNPYMDFLNILVQGGSRIAAAHAGGGA